VRCTLQLRLRAVGRATGVALTDVATALNAIAPGSRVERHEIGAVFTCYGGEHLKQA